MIMTGAMVIIGRGTTVQPLIATLLQLCMVLLILKLAPYNGQMDDWSSFLTSITLAITIMIGFALAGDSGSNDDSNDGNDDDNFDQFQAGENTKKLDNTVITGILISITIVCIASELTIMFYTKFEERIHDYLETRRIKKEETEWEEA
jgi:hypothetical protein